MTAYRRNIVAWVCIIALELLIGISAIYISNWFIVPFLIIIYTIQFILERITCPNCGTPVTYQGTIAGIRVRGGFIRKRCQQCGWDLDKNP